MKRLLFFIPCFIYFCLIISNNSFAQTRVAIGTPSVYKVTMIKEELSQDGGTTWITIADQQTTVDIASVSAGAKVADWISNVSLPAGTYNRMRHTVSATFAMQGYVYYSTTAKTYYTTSSGIASVDGNITDTSLMSGYGEQSITIPEGGDVSGGRIVATEVDNFTVTAGVTMTERISFNVSNTLGLYQSGPNYVFYPEPPSVDAQ